MVFKIKFYYTKSIPLINVLDWGW